MSAASIVSKRRFTPSIDLSDATIPTPTDAGVVAEATALAANLIRRKARSDADALILLNALGIDEVTA